MKFSISRENFLQPLQLVSGAVERRHTLPILSNVLIKVSENSLWLTGTDLEVELIYADGTTEIKTFRITRKKSVFILPDDKVVTAMKFDPNVKLLYEREGN